MNKSHNIAGRAGRLAARQWQKLVGQPASEKSRLHKVLVDGGIRLWGSQRCAWAVGACWIKALTQFGFQNATS